MENLQNNSEGAKVSDAVKDVDINKFIEKIKLQEKELILSELAKRVSELDAILEEENFKIDGPSSGHNDMRNMEQIPENPDMEEMTAADRVSIMKASIIKGELVKFRVQQLLEDGEFLKTWIRCLTLSKQKISDLIMEIVDDVFNEVHRMQNKAKTFYQRIPVYLESRGEMNQKSSAYPKTDDFRIAVRELDEVFYYQCRLLLLEFRNHYAILYDIIAKNFEHLKESPSVDLPQQK